MPSTSILAGISQEATQQELLANMTYLLAAILEKLPRMDGADRLIISHAESAVTVSALSGLGASTTPRPADAIPAHVSNVAALHIYDNIKVS